MQILVLVRNYNRNFDINKYPFKKPLYLSDWPKTETSIEKHNFLENLTILRQKTGV